MFFRCWKLTLWGPRVSVLPNWGWWLTVTPLWDGWSLPLYRTGKEMITNLCPRSPSSLGTGALHGGFLSLIGGGEYPGTTE